MILNDCNAKPAHNITIAVKLFDDMRYYNIASRVFVKHCVTGTYTSSAKKILINSVWKQPPEDWARTNIDASAIQQSELQ